MHADQLKLLLRSRAEALAPDTAVLDRALARCARMNLRQSAASGRQGTSTLATLPSQPSAVAAITPASGTAIAGTAATIVSQPPTPGHTPQAAVQSVTVQSLATAATASERLPHGQLVPGTIIAGYRIEGLLGKGGMGSVYRATQLSMNRPIAFKVLSPRFADDPTFVGRFRREARAAGRLHHPNLVTVHDSGEADGLVFFSMELVEGRSLKAVLKERGSLPADEALRLARQALDALAYAHGKGVVHRDIKPDNLMLTANGQLKIADLGLSRIDEGKDAGSSDLFQTSAGSFMGTPHYMAPEQGRDAHTADQRSDLYALGATLYHLVCGRPPFNGTTPMEVLIAAQSQPLAWPPETPLPAPARDFISRLLEKDPAQRPQDAQTALNSLDRLLTPREVPQQPAPRRSWRRRLASVAAIVVSVLLILGVFAYVAEKGRQRTWEETLATAQSDAGDKRFAEALDRLHRARMQMRDGSPRATACDGAVTAISRAWDAWALPQVVSVERSVREHLAAGRHGEALASLRKVPESWRSPEADRRLEALQREWEESAARDPERKPEAKGLLDELHDRRTEIWRKARVEPPEALQLRGGAAIFTGSGSGRLPPPVMGNLGLTTLRLLWRGTPQPGAQWRIEVGGAAFVLRGDGASLGGTPVPRGDDGSYAIGVLRGPNGLALLARGRDGPITLPLPPGEPLMTWTLGACEVEAVLGGRGQRGGPGPR